MGYVAAFAKYGAKLTNQNWSVSAFAPGGCLVLGLWDEYLKRGHGGYAGALVFEGKVSRWMDGSSGKREVLEHFKRAHEDGAKVRLVLLHQRSEDRGKVGNVADERKISKEYSTPDFIGFIDHFDGDAFRVVFRRAG